MAEDNGIGPHVMKGLPKAALAMFCTFAAVLAVCMSLLVAAFSLPAGPVRASAERSVSMLEQEGVYPRVFDIENFRLDNWTDATMFGVAAVDDGTGLEGALLARQPAGNDPISALKSFLAGNQIDTPDYSRYWHGYQVLLRPAMYLGFDYGQIRIANGIVQAALLVLAILSLCRARLARLATALVATALSASAVVFPLSLQYSSVYCVALLSLSLALLLRRRLRGLVPRCAFMLAVGMVTNFVDFLTFPLMTLGLPLVSLIVLDANSNLNPGDHFSKERVVNPIALVILLSISWAAGYGLMWISKWVIASVILCGDYITPALEQAAMRSSHSLNPNAGTGLTSFTLADLAREIGRYWISPVALAPFVVSALGYAVSRIACKARGLTAGGRGWPFIVSLLLVALIPVAWFLVLGNHSFQHAWFAFRTASVSEFALLALLSPMRRSTKIEAK
ncbi:hypothetical protein QUW40_06350 [Collinsella tanakaei]|uniref:hypothetical protein n=1 Tax=Collinsella tanakaei TaxID=626935 RepID=UPI0025A3A801|nr:hypothetical protein [Collinsella tanakaei]MDM8246220.1 hypothetical protein [Collinsella tanakaei]